MRRPTRPVFLARAPYRRRRLRDAARLLPLLGFLLLLLPILWQDGPDLPRVSDVALYFFGVWAVLILLAAVFASGLKGGEGEEEEED